MEKAGPQNTPSGGVERLQHLRVTAPDNNGGGCGEADKTEKGGETEHSQPPI